MVRRSCSIGIAEQVRTIHFLRPTSSSLLSTGTFSQPSGPTEGPLTPSASRVVGDGNGASRPPVAGSAEFPGFALYQSVLLIISPFS